MLTDVDSGFFISKLVDMGLAFMAAFTSYKFIQAL